MRDGAALKTEKTVAVPKPMKAKAAALVKGAIIETNENRGSRAS